MTRTTIAAKTTKLDSVVLISKTIFFFYLNFWALLCEEKFLKYKLHCKLWNFEFLHGSKEIHVQSHTIHCISQKVDNWILFAFSLLADRHFLAPSNRIFQSCCKNPWGVFFAVCSLDVCLSPRSSFKNPSGQKEKSIFDYVLLCSMLF